MTNYDEVVECLVCGDVFGEIYEKTISICPHCGNDDMQRTIYLCEESEIRIEFLKTMTKVDNRTTQTLH
jgi:predicted  nucleic acid-binding Zn-ribbon protein